MREYLRANPQLAAEIEAKIRAAVNVPLSQPAVAGEANGK